MALVNQGRALLHEQPLKHVISDIYALAPIDFHDITTGNNGFAAFTGYDLVTGRGTPNASFMVPDLIHFNENPLPFKPLPVNIIYGPISTTVGNALPASPFFAAMNSSPATDTNSAEQVESFGPPKLHSLSAMHPTDIALATQPIDFAALLAHTQADDQVDRLIDSLFDFGGRDHPGGNFGKQIRFDRR
jgi:hypothetical protein